ncbi:Esterase FE4 [Ooceraea biroi]|nr:Esterase FE4 [Ooceraea biroi]
MDSEQPRVHVQEGGLIGVIDENVYGKKYIAFRGIPYAQPPVGALRFKNPVPMEPWTGYRDASKYGNICIQQDMFSSEIIGDEDCLFLNVYTTDMKPHKKRSVMVWIHGGGYVVGMGDESLYGPDHIVQKDVVLVTLNYRLGALGFLNLDDEVAAGNQGLQDVILALRWVQKNIAAFGGDPKDVTIFGESAGGGIVSLLTLSPLAEGLFHKAIAQSGVALNPWALYEWSKPTENNGFLLTKKLGKTTTDPKVAYEFLKTVEARKFVEYMNSLPELNNRRADLPFAPTVDTKSASPVFPEHPQILLQRNGIKVPFLLGCNGREGSFLLQGKFYGNITKKLFEEVNADFSKAIPSKLLPTLPVTPGELKAYYFGKKPVSEETFSSYVDFVGDAVFYQGITKLADIQSQRTGKPTYFYYFTYDNEAALYRKILNVDIPGTVHTAELGYLFHPHVIKYLGLSPIAPGSEDYKMINRLVQMWTDFAKTGDPTPAITELTPVKWTPLKPGDVLDVLNIDTKPEMKTFRKGKERWNWENIKNKQ